MTKTLYDPVLLAKALAGTVFDDDFASFAHSGRVAARVADWTSHELPRVVAWLHDVVEDSDVTLADIERDFGASVATACLLYTSPSPRDRTRSRMPSSA